MSHRKRLRRIGEGAATVPVTKEAVKKDIRALLNQIYDFYKAALDQLPTEEIPSLAPRLLSAGVCFGVLDPVSNIIANAISYSPPSPTPTNPDDDDDEEKAAQPHTRESVLSRIVSDTDDFLHLRLSAKTAERMTVARRSLEGLVSFLIFYFRYLAETEALRYLRLAGADLLAAVRLILLDRNSSIHPQRGKPGFSVISLTTKVALGCAAVSAKHPEPPTFLRASQLLAAQLDNASMILPVLHKGRPISSANLKRLSKLLKREPRNIELTDLCYSQPLQLAGSRYHDARKKTKRKKEKLPSGGCAGYMEMRKKRKVKQLPSGASSEYTKRGRRKRKAKEVSSGASAEYTESRKEVTATFRYTQTLKLLLLDKIHAHYLEALARLPGGVLRKCHHSSLLRAGYCYGPMDPVSNIILNTIWYAATFPTHCDFEVTMICTKTLRRIECCSLYGLVAFLRGLFNTLTEHEALWYLLVSNIDAASAVTMAEQHDHVMSGAYQEAYSNAALNSWHPDPDALLKLTMSLLLMAPVELSFLLNDCALSNSEVEQLGMALSSLFEVQVSPLDQEEILSVNQKRFISDIRKKFQDDQEFFASKVNAALSNYSKKNGGHFEIHIICGVNPNVSEGARSHINFWAIPKGSNVASTTPILFFAECSNDADEEEESMCFSLSSASIDSGKCAALTVNTME
ncbi:uncharacterized protein [Setaria viridis]|uniref:Uncharacterized protein n=1 Tax=Setaria viridis TaxID=4556 RepID=A0A4U6TC87_SETVI|nr:hypothetical protein SEVIR_9G556050v2 [Setaria viridis]TKV98365.1 hypothetical protein SEVIR_9G556050v2 [Setaria viridis]